MNLLTDRLLTISDNTKVSLPELFAAMARGEVQGFPAMRPHQRPAWHMFLVQLGALSLWAAGRDTVPAEPTDWAAILRGADTGPRGRCALAPRGRGTSKARLPSASGPGRAHLVSIGDTRCAGLADHLPQP